MMQEKRLLEALAQIATAANAAVDECAHGHGQHAHADSSDDGGHDDVPGCVVKSLPQRLLVKAAYTARTLNPVNAPALISNALISGGIRIDDPMRIAVLTSKYWGPQLRRMTVSFMESTPSDLQKRIISHMNAWSGCCGISFVATSGVGDVRISRQPGGYWSYLGTDIQHIPKNRQTMNLEGFTMNTPESEYKRVVRHETGHTLGFPHEHMRASLVARIDPAKAYAWFLKTYGWDKATVDAQVLTSLSEASLMATPPDQTSIMCYQLPAAITKDGKPITGGIDINKTDCGFAGRIYPKAGRALVLSGDTETSEQSQVTRTDDWPEEEDVEVFV
ncbi:M12 family metallopeptidase [Variovorax sp. J31P207]|uniref:M12 family metallopeptidase n=1 Tax=Variovorax sp. J31P207 TaxID=3053510 RepID=UPI002577EF13|nr:M12 family metallopeptidase [Variovorax sp. J31P207]MDM0065423.1 M12 family metallopeptidase [Variovorax sp. J31P207]